MEDPLLRALADTTQALAWHAALQTYLLIALAVGTLVGFWSTSRNMHALGRRANAVAERLNHRP